MNKAKEKWLQVLADTRKAIESYDSLRRKWIILANFSEDTSQQATFLAYAEKYAEDKEELEKFLTKLEGLKEYYE